MSQEKKFRAISITVPSTVMKVVDFLNTEDFSTRPQKGALSGLVTMLLIRWVELKFRADWLEIEATIKSNPESNLKEIQEFFLTRGDK